MEIKRDHILTGSFCALGCEILYGLSYIFTKQATSEVSALSLLGWRFLLAFIVMSILAGTGFIKIRLKGRNVKPLLWIALFSPGIYFIGETFGISHTTASESGAFLACIPVASLIASSLILKKKPTKKQILGILVTLAGVLLTVFAVGVSSSFSFTGYAFLLTAVISYAMYCVFVEKAEKFAGEEITYVMLATGAVIFMILAVIEALNNGTIELLVTMPFRNRGFLMAVLYQGIGCSVLAFFLSNVAIAKIGVNRTSSFIGVSTVVSIIAGAVLLHEAFTIWQVVGTVIIVTGVYIANYRKN